MKTSQILLMGLLSISLSGGCGTLADLAAPIGDPGPLPSAPGNEPVNEPASEPQMSVNVEPVPEGQAVDASWNVDSDQVQGYEVYAGPSQTGPWLLVASLEPAAGTKRIEGLSNGVPIWIKVVALFADTTVSGIISAVPEDVVAPPFPTLLDVFDGRQGMLIEWNYETGLPSDLAGFRVYRSRLGVSWQMCAEVSSDENAWTINFDQLDDGYLLYRVTALDDSGNESDLSGILGIDW